MFLINYQHTRSYATFLLNFDTLQNRFQACRYNPVTPMSLADMYLQLHKVLLANTTGILSRSCLKSPILRNKNMLLFGKCL